MNDYFLSHRMIYDTLGVINVAMMAYVLGRSRGISIGAYEGAKQAVRLLDERGLIVDNEDEEDSK